MVTVCMPAIYDRISHDPDVSRAVPTFVHRRDRVPRRPGFGALVLVEDARYRIRKLPIGRA
jgi:hypothetical protein